MFAATSFYFISNKMIFHPDSDTITLNLVLAAKSKVKNLFCVCIQLLMEQYSSVQVANLKICVLISINQHHIQLDLFKAL